MPTYYLDHNASSPLLPEAFEAMKPWLTEDFGNPSATHRAGQKARSAVEGARERLAGLLNCKASELIFTSGGTEAINLALRGAFKPGQTLFTARTEHDATLKTAAALAREGADLVFLETDLEGQLEKRPFAPGLVSLMHANNETGVIHPIARLAEAAHSAGTLFHCDAIQSFGKLPVDLKVLGVDLASFSAHKFGGPKGVGLLFKSEKIDLAPQATGGGQEGGLRPGTENVAGIIGMAAAAQVRLRDLEAVSLKQTALRDLLQAELKRRISGLKIVAEGSLRISNTFMALFPGGVESDLLIMRLDQEGVLLSAGSACAAGALEPSHVLRAMGIEEAAARSVLRFSLGTELQEADILKVAQLVELAWKGFEKAVFK